MQRKCGSNERYTNHILHLFLVLATAGFWFIIYGFVIGSSASSTPKCEQCATKTEPAKSEKQLAKLKEIEGIEDKCDLCDNYRQRGNARCGKCGNKLR